MDTQTIILTINTDTEEVSLLNTNTGKMDSGSLDNISDLQDTIRDLIKEESSWY